jgi:putative hydrolase of the HAD superfamily
MIADASSATGRRPPPRAVLLDALGTLVELDEPVARLRTALRARGIVAGPRAVGAALQAEIAYYRTHHDVARDEPSLARLRDACSDVFRDALGEPARASDHATVRAALLEGLRFRAFPEVRSVLEALRARGARVVVVSNWDVSLHEVLRELRLDALVDAVLTSAQEGVAKPDAELFRRALALVGGVAPQDAVHVGDDVVADVEGARAAGIRPVLLDRAGDGPRPHGVAVAATLEVLL